MNTSSPLKSRLVALRLNHLPPIVLTWIERDLEGMDNASIAATLTPEYAARAVRFAVAEMVSVGLGARPPEGR